MKKHKVLIISLAAITAAAIFFFAVPIMTEDDGTGTGTTERTTLFTWFFESEPYV